MTEEQERVVIRDNRKIDREQAAAAAAASDVPPVADAPAEDVLDAPDENVVLLEERTRDLQRLQAEYANYRKRSERDRLAAGELATGKVLAELLPIVDDLDRAKAHGDLAGPLKAVADKLDGVLAKLGLTAFGEVGDPFDPSRHEAVLHDESDAVTVATCTTVMRQGYTHGDRLLRPAMVGVSDPAHGAGPETADAIEDATAGAERHVDDQHDSNTQDQSTTQDQSAPTNERTNDNA